MIWGGVKELNYELCAVQLQFDIFFTITSNWATSKRLYLPINTADTEGKAALSYFA